MRNILKMMEVIIQFTTITFILLKKSALISMEELYRNAIYLKMNMAGKAIISYSMIFRADGQEPIE
jgi:hypothetical protein